MPTIRTFGPFRLDTEAEILFRGAEPVDLGRRAVALLCALTERPGAVVSKDALIEAAWSDVAVEESNLTVQISALRRALGGEGWIETLPRRGYRFVGPAVTPEENVGTAGAAERRQLTVMSCELVGAAVQSSGMDLEEFWSVIGIYQGTVVDTAGRFGGVVSKHLGNTVLVYFGYPAAHEADAERAVHAGLELCSAVGALKASCGFPFKCRIGIATGLVVVGDASKERGIIGDAPNLAMRLQAMAEPNTVAIDRTTRRLVGNLFDCRALGAIEITEAAEPVEAWQVMGAGTFHSRSEALHSADLTPLVGREGELQALERRWRQAADGEGRLVLITGEPGIGKSRLIAALHQCLPGEAHTTIRCFCSPHHQDSVLYPVIRHLEYSAGFARDDATEAKLDKLATLLGGAGPAEGDISLIVELMSLPGGERYPPLDFSPQRKREQTLAALLRHFEGIARRQMLLIIFEDLHWIDPTSRAMLDLLAERIDRLPLLLVATCRPDFQPPWLDLPATTLIALDRLSRSEAAVLVRQVAANAESLSQELVNEIVERTNGVPLFVEELTKAVLEARADRSPRTIAGAPPLSPEIPATLHASLMARLDRLGPAAKQVAQIGAAVGKEFPYELVKTAGQLPEPLIQGQLQRLVGAGLLFQRGPPAHPSYLFKHALVQDIAYATLLRQAREELHARIARALEQHFPERADAEPELVADHFAKAGIPDKAADYFLRAGQLSLQRSALVEAVHHLERGLQVLDEVLAGQPSASRTLIEQAIDLRLALQGALYPQGEIERTLDHLRAAQSLTESLGDEQRLGRVLAHMALCFFWMGDRDRAVASGERALAIASGLNDFPLRVLANHRLGQAYFFTGDFRRAAELFRRNIEKLEGKLAYERLGLPVLPSIGSRAYLGWCLAMLGDFASAIDIIEEGVRVAESAQHPYSTMGMYRCAAMPAFFQGRFEEAITWLERSQDLHHRGNVPVLGPFFASFLGEAYARCGRLEQGLPLVEQAAEQLGSMRMMAVYSPTLVSLSTVYGLAGRPADALQSAERALLLSRTHKQRGVEADTLRILGDIHARQVPSNVEAADRCYREALSLASELGMRPLLAHCHFGLGNLYHGAGKRKEAQDHLIAATTMYREMNMQFG
jgi:class 3 adenylate cyclase/tetratricopeptide (TPR) repeat protein